MELIHLTRSCLVKKYFPTYSIKHEFSTKRFLNSNQKVITYPFNRHATIAIASKSCLHIGIAFYRVCN